MSLAGHPSSSTVPQRPSRVAPLPGACGGPLKRGLPTEARGPQGSGSSPRAGLGRRNGPWRPLRGLWKPGLTRSRPQDECIDGGGDPPTTGRPREVGTSAATGAGGGGMGETVFTVSKRRKPTKRFRGTPTVLNPP